MSTEAQKALLKWVFLSVLLLVIILAVITFYLKQGKATDVLGNEPRIILWAWEYPANWQFLDTKQVGVAFLAAKALLIKDDVVYRPRAQVLAVPSKTYTIAVIRIESGRATSLSYNQLENLTTKILGTLSENKVNGLQLDFDARSSERTFYRQLLTTLRRRMPSNMPLSITCLASWCLGDNWIDDLPCNEVVPMFFSMGKDRQRMLSYLSEHKLSNCMPAQLSLGLSVAEPDVLDHISHLPAHVYLFSDKGWKSYRSLAFLDRIKAEARLAKNY
jgi:hypothetical protein